MKIKPNDAFTYVCIGSAKHALNDYQEAISYFDLAIEILPNSGNIYRNRGYSKKELGDLKGACKDWAKGSDLGDKEAKDLFQKYC